jgi:hypothetical protein
MPADCPAPPARRPWDIPPLWLALPIVAMVALDCLLPIARLISWP